MSFLDPRSLCRCAQVCWFWKYLSELDQIWMPKCFKFGWLLPFVPTPYEQGVWKRHYLECVRGLQYMRPKVKERFSVLHNLLNSDGNLFNQGLKNLEFQLLLWGSSCHIFPPLANSCLSLLVIHLENDLPGLLPIEQVSCKRYLHVPNKKHTIGTIGQGFFKPSLNSLLHRVFL